EAGGRRGVDGRAAQDILHLAQWRLHAVERHRAHDQDGGRLLAHASPFEPMLPATLASEAANSSAETGSGNQPRIHKGHEAGGELTTKAGRTRSGNREQMSGRPNSDHLRLVSFEASSCPSCLRG